MSVSMGVTCERDDALRDAQATAAEYGLPITVSVRVEADVERDAYGSQKRRPTATTLATHALPWAENPSRRELERAGLAGDLEEIAAVATTPMKDWTDAGLSWEDVDPVRTTVIAAGQRFEVESRGRTNQFADAFLHLTLALRRA